jgi:hypothetical protein
MLLLSNYYTSEYEMLLLFLEMSLASGFDIPINTSPSPYSPGLVLKKYIILAALSGLAMLLID